MRSIKLAIALPLTAAVMLSTAGCSNNYHLADTRDTVKVYCWSDHMLYSGYAEYVQSQIPDADVVFITGQNNMSYYEFMDDNGALPDIITVRRMSMIDAKALRNSLMDLSETEVAAGFNNIYLENYRFEDGSINWLPACGEVDGYIANLDLFDKYGIELPTDRKSFDEMCAKFKEVGIQPYSNDFGKDYTCLQSLQGVAIPEMMTAAGLSWRTGYESGNNRQLDDTIWRGAFDRLEQMLKTWGTQKEAAEYAFDDMAAPFLEGKAAMMRGTGNDVIAFKKDGMNVCMLPYFGDTKDDNWLLTYPSFNVAVSKKVSDNPEHEALCMKVLEVMFSEGAQSVLAGNHNMIPYNMDVHLELDNSMSNLEPYIASNHLYLRLASNEIFRISKETVGKMVTGEYSAQQAYDEFNRLLAEENSNKSEVVAHFDHSYSNDFDPAKGNEAASVMTNTLREYFKSDILIAHGAAYSGIVYASDYTEDQLKYMISDATIHNFTKTIKGSEIKYLVKNLLENKYGNVYGTMGMLNRYSLPCSSGCELVIKQTEQGYTLESITINGKEMNDDDTFRFTYIANRHTARGMLDELWADEGGYQSWEITEDTVVQQHWLRCILGSEDNEPIPLAAPTDYIDLIV